MATPDEYREILRQDLRERVREVFETEEQAEEFLAICDSGPTSGEAMAAYLSQVRSMVAAHTTRSTEMLEVKRTDFAHGRGVRIEESVGSGVTALVLESPSDTPKVFLRMTKWKSEHARKRDIIEGSLGLELEREGIEALHTMLGELLSDPGTFVEEDPPWRNDCPHGYGFDDCCHDPDVCDGEEPDESHA